MRDGILYEGNYYLVEDMEGFFIDKMGVAHVPDWVYAADDPDGTVPDWAFAEKPDWIYIARNPEADRTIIAQREKALPKGTVLQVVFPLYGKEVAGRDEVSSIRSYLGYLVRIKENPSK